MPAARPMFGRGRKRADITDVSSIVGRVVDKVESTTGFKIKPQHLEIPPEMTFTAWCEMLGREGLKVDGQPFTLDDRPAMRWLYDLIPSTREQGWKQVLVLMKCAQVGFTVMEMLATIYLGVKFAPCTVGMFLPDQGLAQIKSTERFIPIVRSIPRIWKLMTQDAGDGSGKKQGEGNVRTRRINGSLYAFSWTSGRATTESIPMDVLSFDEVQEMTKEQMEKTRERLSASKFRYTLMGSTANWPDEDIHHWFKLGTQHRFWTRCPICGEYAVLDDYFPDCIRWFPDLPDPDKPERMGAHGYVCRAGHLITDSQDGEWRPDRPEADIVSVHFPQFLSPTITPNDIMWKYTTSTDKKNFYNRVLGKPWLNPAEIPVTMEHMNRCVDYGKRAGLRWKKRARQTFMGIDQMSFNAVVIKERMPDGRQAVVHVEEVYTDRPFERCSELMDLYGVQACVVEINPNYTEAKLFAQRHPGKVFICDGFGELPDDMIKWGDTPKQDASDRRTSDEAADKYTVKCDQFKCMQTSLSRFTSNPPLCLWPDPKELEQEVVDKGVRHMAQVASRAFVHFTKTALVVEKAPDTGKSSNRGTNQYKRRVRKVGIDPHFSYANQLCDVAWARAHGTATFMLPDALPTEEEKRMGAAAKNVPGLPDHVVGMMTDTLPPGVICGRCLHYPLDEKDETPVQGVCNLRKFIVQARDPGCDIFDSAS